MKCDFCNGEASVYLTQMVEGQVKKVSLCDSCAKKHGVTDPTGFALADLVLGSTPSVAVPGSTSSPRRQSRNPDARACPACGFTLDDLAKVRRFGCGSCYAAFADEVQQILQGMHQDAVHVGKIPAGLMERTVLKQRLEELEGRLDAAIAAESYEEAASIRDEIVQLRNQSKP
ncbi:MAG: UvrB/UvrC motif-containing protein [Luteolibacter sp.]|jgi:protein arginine kinase activator